MQKRARTAPTNALHSPESKRGTAPLRAAKVVGGSTISQQLAKNLFLGGERSLARKAQELMLTWTMELLLGKRRILEIYLNSVEWGEGVFGAEAASRHYFGIGANALSAQQAAQLAVMLPAPKRFEKTAIVAVHRRPHRDRPCPDAGCRGALRSSRRPRDPHRRPAVCGLRASGPTPRIRR